jgi:hypothetical protein
MAPHSSTGQELTMHLQTRTAAVIGTVAMRSGAVALAAPAAGAATPWHIYWADGYTNSIGESNLDRGDANPNFITGLGNPTGVAVAGDHVYWSNQKPTRSGGRTSTAPPSTRTSFPEPPGLDRLQSVPAVSTGAMYIPTRSPRRTSTAPTSTKNLINVGDRGGVAVNDQNIYFCSDAAPFIADANLDGGDVS